MGLFSSECAHCGSKEHATSDCPHGIFSSKCTKCGSKDHATNDCPHGIFSSKCAKCGSTDHATNDCPHGFFSSKCAKCGSKEHSTNDCPHGIFSSECANCGSKNHRTADCPQGIFSTSKVKSTNTTSSTSDESGCATLIGWLIGIGIIVFVVIWLAVNVVLPVVFLNSALALTILAFVLKQRKTLFAALALVGGFYMILDITNGWFSINFINNVVKDPIWITIFVYMNTIAVGVSTGLLIRPLWLKAKNVESKDKGAGTILIVSSIIIILITSSVIPIIFNCVPNHLYQNSMIMGSQNNNSELPPSNQTNINSNNSSINSGQATYSNHKLLTFSIKLPSSFKVEPMYSDNNYDHCDYSVKTSDGFEIMQLHSLLSSRFQYNDIKEFYKAALNKSSDDITYKTQKRNWFILSGYIKGSGNIFYWKRISGNQYINDMRIEYPKERANQIEPFISEIQLSLTCQ